MFHLIQGKGEEAEISLEEKIEQEEARIRGQLLRAYDSLFSLEETRKTLDETILCLRQSLMQLETLKKPSRMGQEPGEPDEE